MRFLLIDHFDSFTHNVASWLREDSSIQIDLKTYGEDFQIDEYDLIILSPGPKSPKEYPLSLKLLQKHPKTPILGICLGLQMMVEEEGGIISPYSPPLHGKTSKLLIPQRASLFSALEGIQVARYHSLRVEKIPESFELLGISGDSSPMAIKHQDHPWLGLQFHPESFLTERADDLRQIIMNWVKSC